MALQVTADPQSNTNFTLQGGSNSNLRLLQPSATPSAQPANNQSTAGYDAFIKAQQALQQQIAAANQHVYAPNLDLVGLNAQARKQATAAVNPYYTKLLNQFVTEQAYQKGQAQKQAQTETQNLQDTLNQTLQGNAITGQRTAEDTARNISDINTAADQFQTDSGQAYDAARLQQAGQVSTGGLGQQQLEAGQQANATAESRQGAQAQEQRQQQQINQARTFADLSRAGELATQAKTKGVKQVNFNLSDFLHSQTVDLTSKKQSLEEQRLQRVGQETNNQAKLAVNKFIASIADPAQRSAALSAYGGIY